MRIVMTNIVGCLKNPDFKEKFWREKLDETKQVTISLSVCGPGNTVTFRPLANEIVPIKAAKAKMNIDQSDIVLIETKMKTKYFTSFSL